MSPVDDCTLVSTLSRSRSGPARLRTRSEPLDLHSLFFPFPPLSTLYPPIPSSDDVVIDPARTAAVCSRGHAQAIGTFTYVKGRPQTR
mgnify:CR=1 FL=1|jgi:hypothetical protein